MITTTLNEIRDCFPGNNEWIRLLKYLGKTRADDEPLPLLTVLDSNGLDDALWCTRCIPEHDKAWRLFAMWCARKIQHLMDDERSINALDVAERHASGHASDTELAAARSAALAAARFAARSAARSAALAAARSAARSAARFAARSAALDAALAAALDAAGDAARSAARSAAGDAALAAAGDAALAAARAEQEAEFRRIIF